MHTGVNTKIWTIGGQYEHSLLTAGSHEDYKALLRLFAFNFFVSNCRSNIQNTLPSVRARHCLLLVLSVPSLSMFIRQLNYSNHVAPLAFVLSLSSYKP